MEPILRWVGGKSRNIKQFKKFYPRNVADHLYIELCFGSGAFYFDIKPKYAIINDINPHLMNMYLQVKENHIVLLDELKKHEKYDSKQHYEHVVKMFNGMSDIIYDPSWKEYDQNEYERIQMAGYFIYLNSRGFNGLYRENSKGEYNVAYDKEKKIKISSYKKKIERMSKFLNSNTCYITSGSYEKIFDFLREPFSKAKEICENPTIDNLQFYALRKLVHQLDLFKEKAKNHQVFFMLDTPYYPLDGKKNFTSYHKESWDDEDFDGLREFVDKLNKKSFKFMLCNSDTDYINGLFSNYHIYKHNVSRSVSCKANERKPVGEVVITNYKIITLDDYLKE